MNLKKIEVNKKFTKLNYGTLLIEMTTKCNLKCKHCFKYDDYDMDKYSEFIDKKVIDEFFDNNVGAITHLALTGGEPLLNIDMFEYIVDKIIKNNIPICQFDFIINGTVLDKRVADILNKMGKYVYEYRESFIKNVSEDKKSDLLTDDEGGIATGIRISVPYHENNPQNAYDYYKKYVNDKYVWVMVQDKSENEISIAYSGRAKQLKDCSFFADSIKHKIEFDDNGWIKCPILVHCNGDISIDGYCKIEDSKKYAMGNIFENFVTDMIRENEYNNPLTCNEACGRENARVLIETGKVTEPQNIKECRETIEKIDRLESMRIQLHKEYPYLKSNEIQDFSFELCGMEKIYKNYKILQALNKLSVRKRWSKINAKRMVSADEK